MIETIKQYLKNFPDVQLSELEAFVNNKENTRLLKLRKGLDSQADKIRRINSLFLQFTSFFKANNATTGNFYGLLTHLSSNNVDVERDAVLLWFDFLKDQFQYEPSNENLLPIIKRCGLPFAAESKSAVPLCAILLLLIRRKITTEAIIQTGLLHDLMSHYWRASHQPSPQLSSAEALLIVQHTYQLLSAVKDMDPVHATEIEALVQASQQYLFAASDQENGHFKFLRLDGSQASASDALPFHPQTKQEPFKYLEYTPTVDNWSQLFRLFGPDWMRCTLANEKSADLIPQALTQRSSDELMAVIHGLLASPDIPLDSLRLVIKAVHLANKSEILSKLLQDSPDLTWLIINQCPNLLDPSKIVQAPIEPWSLSDFIAFHEAIKGKPEKIAEALNGISSVKVIEWFDKLQPIATAESLQLVISNINSYDRTLLENLMQARPEHAWMVASQNHTLLTPSMLEQAPITSQSISSMIEVGQSLEPGQSKNDLTKKLLDQVWEHASILSSLYNPSNLVTDDGTFNDALLNSFLSLSSQYEDIEIWVRQKESALSELLNATCSEPLTETEYSCDLMFDTYRGIKSHIQLLYDLIPNYRPHLPNTDLEFRACILEKQLNMGIPIEEILEMIQPSQSNLSPEEQRRQFLLKSVVWIVDNSAKLALLSKHLQQYPDAFILWNQPLDKLNLLESAFIHHNDYLVEELLSKTNSRFAMQALETHMQVLETQEQALETESILNQLAKVMDSVVAHGQNSDTSNSFESSKIQDQEGKTALHRAYNYPKTLKLILYSSPEPTKRFELASVQDRNGQTALHLTCNNFEASSVILDSVGGSTNRRDLVCKQDSHGQTALHLACNNPVVSKIILDSFNKNTEQVNLVKMQDNQGKTALHLAIDNPVCERIILDLLTKEQRRTVIKIQDNQGQTALHEAIKKPKTFNQLAEFFMFDEGFKVEEIINSKGQTILHTAQENPEDLAIVLNSDLSKYCLAAINAKDNDGKTAIQLAQDNPKSLSMIFTALPRDKRLECGRTIINDILNKPDSLKVILQAIKSQELIQLIQEKVQGDQTLADIILKTPDLKTKLPCEYSLIAAQQYLQHLESYTLRSDLVDQLTPKKISLIKEAIEELTKNDKSEADKLRSFYIKLQTPVSETDNRPILSLRRDPWLLVFLKTIAWAITGTYFEASLFPKPKGEQLIEEIGQIKKPEL